MKPGSVVISGIGQTEFGKLPGRSTNSMNAEACRKALQDAGVEKDRVDALFVKYPTSSFARMLLTCPFTASSFIESFAAICLFDRPSAIRRSTRVSDGESVSAARVARPNVTSGDNTLRPLWTARIVVRSSVRMEFFRR